ncbi:hypothetical protein AVEN_204783-1 [Araneus ventricosus]|uniref:Uncharacterized protein n=1 Tax=Araneus ventricosus TaxID=182803 RepID=A0A4Y2LBH9_ARAVE|nr:hypothetical protein AVEN_204783-1 [Araneus ventricosus]
MWRATLELAPPSLRFHTTPAGGRLNSDFRFNLHEDHKHDETSVESGFKPGAIRFCSRGPATRNSWPVKAKETTCYYSQR